MQLGTVDGDGEVPAGLVYACRDALDAQAVFIPVTEGERLVVVVEPGHDPSILWGELRDFMKREGIQGASNPAA